MRTRNEAVQGLWRRKKRREEGMMMIVIMVRIRSDCHFAG